MNKITIQVVALLALVIMLASVTNAQSRCPIGCELRGCGPSCAICYCPLIELQMMNGDISIDLTTVTSLRLTLHQS